MYRKNVGICLMNNDGLIFAGNRLKDFNIKNGWQMPQGGVDSLDNEKILTDGMYRELFEETGLTKDKVQILKKSHKVKYDFPQWVIDDGRKKFGDKSLNIIGQEQIWFLLKFLGQDQDIDLEKDKENQEFFHWKWTDSDFLIDNVIDMKKEVYKEILTLFQYPSDIS